MKKQKKKQKIVPNLGINLEEYINQFNNANFYDFFSCKLTLCGTPSSIIINDEFVFVGTESSFVFLFKHESEFKQGHKVLGHESKKQRGKVIHMECSADNDYLIVTYQNQEFILWDLRTFKEVFGSKIYRCKRVHLVPLVTSQELLSEMKLEAYYELIVQDELDYLFKIPIEIRESEVIAEIPIQLIKMGEPCLRQKRKEKLPAKISDENYIPPMSTKIQDLKIMNQSLEEYIQCMDDRESTASLASGDTPLKTSGAKQKKQKSSFLQKILQYDSPSTKPNLPINSNQYYLIALTYYRRVIVLKVYYGNHLNQEQSKISVILNFNRPDSYIYDLVFDQHVPQSQAAQFLMTQSVCSWGLGNFKETNKRYVLLIVNWGGREYYAFKVMSSEFKLQVVQGGHFFNPIDYQKVEQIPLILDFISNSVLYSYYSNIELEHQLLIMTSSQFEYGVPFTLQQIEKHTSQEKQISNISQGQYQPKFYTFNGAQEVVISQGVMDSINDGLQQANKLQLDMQEMQSNFQMFTYNEVNYILNGCKLLQIKLKKWDEYLYELSDASEWEKCFDMAIRIHQGSLTLLCNIPENDIARQDTLRETFCKLALTYMLLELPNKQLKNSESVFIVMKFLIYTRNEEFLFKSIEDLLIGCGYRNTFYEYLREFIEYTNINIPHENQLRALKMYLDMGDRDTVIRILMSLQNIDLDSKGLVDFCLENDFIEPMMHICSLSNDFLTPYLRILTLLQIIEFQEKNQNSEDRQITTLTLEQLHQYLFAYITFCFTGRFTEGYKREQFFTDKQYKQMLNDLFEYIFENENLLKLFQISYYQSLQVLLHVFQPKIQEILKMIIAEGKQINIPICKFIESSLAEYLNIENTQPHLQQLSYIYSLLKSTEITFFSNSHIDNRNVMYQYSVAFTVHVMAICPLKFTPKHILWNLKHYMSMLREVKDPYFDITWVLRGRVQKDVPMDVIKNEFLLRVIEKIEPLISGEMNALEELKVKSKECQWNWMYAWCHQKLGKTLQSFYIYLQDEDPLISERIFIVLAQLLKENNQEAIFEWILKNLRLLAEENHQKLFQLVFTYCKDQIDIVQRELKEIEDTEVDKKLPTIGTINLCTSFIDYLSHRVIGGIQQKNQQQL